MCVCVYISIYIERETHTHTHTHTHTPYTGRWEMSRRLTASRDTAMGTPTYRKLHRGAESRDTAMGTPDKDEHVSGTQDVSKTRHRAMGTPDFKLHLRVCALCSWGAPGPLRGPLDPKLTLRGLSADSPRLSAALSVPPGTKTTLFETRSAYNFDAGKLDFHSC